ncbi:MAG TPA: branched-chain amino acid ABC transporter permease [Acidimicrobiia bacterium]|nr:branched-chain amino acid ABC transporter permease [Acidimicrobiia bacterium]
MRRRPLLRTTYAADVALFPSTTQKVGMAALGAAAVLAILGKLPFVGYLGTAEWSLVLARVLIFAIGALGLNILVGLAGQVSLGHAFFLGIGAYTAVVLGGSGAGELWGLELPIWIWLPGSGLVAALFGILISPVAVRLRGLYLAIVTLGLVFLGLHLFTNMADIAGSPGVGREWPKLDFRLWKEEQPLVDLTNSGRWFGVDVTGTQKQVLALLVITTVLAFAARNIARTRVGRALAAIRDRDIAAEVMGVAEARYKLVAFGLSSFYAGVAGALLGAVFQILTPETWNLAMSIEFVAILIIGGAGTVSGTLLGSAFVVASGQVIKEVTELLSAKAAGSGFFPGIADFLVSQGTDFGLVSLEPIGKGLSIFQFNQLFYGVLLVVFMLAEPLGLYGIWVRIRAYWKGWPFTY